MLLLFMGSDVRWLDQHITTAIAPFRQQFPDAILERFDGDQLPLESISTIFAGASLFAAQRIVVTTRLAERIIRDDPLLQALERSLATPNPLLCIVFRETTLLEEKHPLTELVQKFHGTVQHVPSLRLSALAQELVRLARGYGVTLQPREADLLASRCTVLRKIRGRDIVEPDLTKGATELGKLVTALNFQGKVTRDLIEQLVPAPEEHVFALIDYVADGNLSAASNALERLFQRGEPPQLLFALLVRHFRQLLWIAASDRQGAIASGAAQAKLGIPAFRVKKLQEQVKRLNFHQMSVILDQLFAYDIALKTGAIEGEQGLRLLVSAICTGSTLLTIPDITRT